MCVYALLCYVCVYTGGWDNEDAAGPPTSYLMYRVYYRPAVAGGKWEPMETKTMPTRPNMVQSHHW